ncbi:uncharacterized protein LOC133921002 [Phragmites australis]|uniref:uncharacterized protein LOC133921002 n=1 Tax=Phragmites australis TaxID=29695 RepID=UPI002D77C8F5|nr:uncharacterized protein LOC133921002 [Phragmites australis]
MASASCCSPTAAVSRAPRSAAAPKKLTCLCSPTNHPGSFRCSRHRSPRGRAAPAAQGGEMGRPGRAAKGRSVRALLLQMISPSDRDRQRRRRGDFQPRPSRLRLMNM